MRGDKSDMENGNPAPISESYNSRAESEEVKSDVVSTAAERETDTRTDCNTANDELDASTGTDDGFEEREGNDIVTSPVQEPSESEKPSTPQASKANCGLANCEKRGATTELSGCSPKPSPVDDLKTPSPFGLPQGYAVLVCRTYKTGSSGEPPMLQITIRDYSGQVLLDKRIIKVPVDSRKHGHDDSKLAETELLTFKKNLKKVSSQVRRIAQDMVALVGVYINTDLRTLNLNGCGEMRFVSPRRLPKHVDPMKVLESRDHLTGMLSLVRGDSTPKMAGASMIDANKAGKSRNTTNDSGYVLVDEEAKQLGTSASPSRTQSEGPEGDAKKNRRMANALRQQYRALAVHGVEGSHLGLTHWPVLHALKESEASQWCEGDIALDCTWVFQKLRRYPVRISIIASGGKVLMDTFVEPPEGELDCRPQWSGITEEVLKIARDAGRMKSRVAAFCEMHTHIRKANAIVGYRLLREWSVLKLHGKSYKFMDLAVLPTLEKYPGLRGPLKQECGIVIQECRKAHDSLEDAAASMLLYKHLLPGIVQESEGDRNNGPFGIFARRN